MNQEQRDIQILQLQNQAVIMEILWNTQTISKSITKKLIDQIVLTEKQLNQLK